MNDTLQFAETFINEAAPPSRCMTGVRVQITSTECVRTITLSVAAANRCPNCRSIIYSRRHRLCGVCSRPLPEEFLFPIPEAHRIKQLMEAERQQHRKWLAAN